MEILRILAQAAPNLTNMSKKRPEKATYIFHGDVVSWQNRSEWKVSKEMYGTLLTARLYNRSYRRSYHQRHNSFPIAFFWRVKLQFFCSELTLLDGSFLGKAAGKFPTRRVCLLKMHFHRNEVFYRNVNTSAILWRKIKVLKATLHVLPWYYKKFHSKSIEYIHLHFYF